MVDTALSSDNLLCFRKYLLERIQKLIIIDGKIRNKKLRFSINREAVKISVLSSSKIDKYLTGEEILPTDQSRMIEQAKVTYSPFRKALENKHKQSKTKSREKTNWIFKSFKT